MVSQLVADDERQPLVEQLTYVNLTWEQVFDQVSLDDHAWFFRAGQSANAEYTQWTSALYDWNNRPEKDSDLDSICTAAKAQGITVFTIGMMVPNSALTVMESCASTPSHFYHVSDLDVSTAFESIARSLTSLQLVH